MTDTQNAFVEAAVRRCRSTWVREGLSGSEIDKKELWLRQELSAVLRRDDDNEEEE
jgi:hypothetical protein